MEISSIIIALAALLFSIASPAITAFLNNQHQLRMKQIEFNLERRAQSIENYIRTTGETIHTGRLDLSHYGTYYGEIFLYVPEALWPYIERIDDYFLCGSFHEAQNDFNELCHSLAELDIRPDISKKHNKKDKVK